MKERLCIGLSVVSSIGKYPVSHPFSIACEIMKLFIRLPMTLSVQEGDYVNTGKLPLKRRNVIANGKGKEKATWFLSPVFILSYAIFRFFPLRLNNVYKKF